MIHSNCRRQGRGRGGFKMEWMMLPLRRYADFTGRSTRQEYWMFVLLCALIYFVALVLFVFVATASFQGGKPAQPEMPTGLLIGILLLVLIYLGLFIPTLAVQARRFHDQE